MDTFAKTRPRQDPTEETKRRGEGEKSEDAGGLARLEPSDRSQMKRIDYMDRDVLVG